MMVYLIDEKKLRQESDYLWTDERFGQFKNMIRCIYTLEELENGSKEIFSNDNIILYHESFIDQTNKSKEAVDKRNKLYAWSENKGNIIVYFSGSKNTRGVNVNIANIPVSTLYANLEIFLKKFSINDINLDYLIFGENINIEKDLKLKQVVSLKETFKEEEITLKGTTLFLCPSRDYISNPFTQFDRKELFIDVSDEKFTEKINDWLNEVTYDYIFLPLCFGNVLSDYNGLRLAAHIRCTSSLNQLSRIFVYGFVGIECLIKNEYFNILKTKNVELIPFSKRAFAEFANKKEDSFTQKELSTELDKLKLDVPGNYFDSHHIANEWGIYQMARNAGLKIKDIEGFEYNKLNTIYFKWLIAKNNLYEELPEDQIKRLKEYSIKLPGLNVKGKIDLDKIRKR